MKVLICGGRNYRSYSVVEREMKTIDAEIDCIIHGCATGADSLGSLWAELNGVSEWRFPAQWSRDGRSAGPRRNTLMLKVGKPDLVIAFPGGRGTAHMVRIAKKAGVPVREIK